MGHRIRVGATIASCRLVVKRGARHRKLKLLARSQAASFQSACTWWEPDIPLAAMAVGTQVTELHLVMVERGIYAGKRVDIEDLDFRQRRASAIQNEFVVPREKVEAKPGGRMTIHTEAIPK
jgi:flagella basal body P-ring formation protein FlgA